MEFQFGQVYIRIVTDLRHSLVSIKIIHPISSDKMSATNIMVGKCGELWETDIDQNIYYKGDKDAEKSAIS